MGWGWLFSGEGVMDGKLRGEILGSVDGVGYEKGRRVERVKRHEKLTFLRCKQSYHSATQ